MDSEFPIAITADLVIHAPVAEVYRAWTTVEGIQSFFAREANIELKIKGAYEIIFLPENPEGSRGGEGNIILTFQENKMLSFTWNAPPEFKEIRNERTHVLIKFIPVNDIETRLLFHQDGWGEGGEWEKSFEYFNHAWKKVVLPRLQYRFDTGPVDWNNPPKME